MAELNLQHILPLQEELNQHPIYSDLHNLSDLQLFMTHHVFPVWDFMSLIKYLQRHFAPTHIPWLPRGNAPACHFINRLVLEEESCSYQGADGRVLYASHFERYLNAMREIGAATEAVSGFLQHIQEHGISQALQTAPIPEPARRFMQTTFCILDEDRPHLAAAALILGRETIIPAMFQRLLQQMEISAEQAPGFHDYLKRHRHFDEGMYGSLSMQMLNSLCQDQDSLIDTEAAAEEALCARIRFWDGVHEAIQQQRS
jgi:hypothetical protein